jgi:uncharacterized oxidoreductase
MPIIHADQLNLLIVNIFEAAGVDRRIARRTADHLIDANLAGVDSHGVLRAPDYADMVLVGTMAREDKIETVRDFGATALWDAHYTFGQHTAWRAVDVATEKAEKFGIGMVAARNSGHIGRLGEYAERMARVGFVGFVTANLQGGGQRVAPFGGRAARLSTNPFAWGFPRRGVPFVIDASTSVSAEGKIRVKMRRGERLAPGWLLDSKGEPTDDPAALYDTPSGAILTFGGHKGFGLSLVAEALGGILPGGGWSRRVEEGQPSADRPGYYGNGFSLIAIHIDALGTLDAFVQGVSELADYCKDTPLMDGANEVLMPNEPEARSRARRLAEGIPIEDETWDLIVAAAARLNVEIPI